ncbi:hypothetical protein F5876DRAFT_78728 [Lentinula aff. lateritia]|uniref:Uncharacterized protein n=1 Tax=Lentinula aff. lateritia TaxID=2804960 RepID=A0ACC1TV22_9AGAR|nr:hypothetical protein F5876DRAFT_78728 [Lentinula aff. lateritia]
MFPSTSPSIPSAGKRFDSLNATQRRAPTNNVLSKSRPGNEFGRNNAQGSTRKVFIAKDEGFFMSVEDELHDLRRVHAHGQEDDLRMALDRCMGRVGELVGLLAAAYLALTDVRVELDVTRSNLQMITANNDMLEDALKSMSNKHGTDPRDVGSVGWRRSGPNPNSTAVTPSSSSTHINTISNDLTRPMNGEAPTTGTSPPSSPPLPASESTTQPMAIPPAPTPQPAPAPQESRFFKFRFNSTSSSSTNNSRPQTPVVGNDTASPTIGNLTGRHRTESSSSVSLLAGGGSIAGGPDDLANANSLDDLRRDIEALKTQMARDKADLEKLKAELDVEKARREKEEEKVGKAKKEKEELEAELESLSQALFEEANNMVATERKLRAETESKLQRQHQDLKEELREARAQREALRSALQVVESEMDVLRMGLGGRDLDGGGADNVNPVLRSNVPQPLNIPEPDESSDEGYLPESEYSALPQTASTMSTMSILSAMSSMSAVHGMPGIPSQPELQAQSEPSSMHPHPNNSESHSEEESHPHPRSRSRSSSQRGIKSPPSSRPGSRTSRRSVYSEFAGYSRPNSVVIPSKNDGGTEGDPSHGDVSQVKESPPTPSASGSVLTPATPTVKRSEPGQFSSVEDQLAHGITHSNIMTNKLQTSSSFTTQSHSTLDSALDTARAISRSPSPVASSHQPPQSQPPSHSPVSDSHEPSSFLPPLDSKSSDSTHSRLAQAVNVDQEDEEWDNDTSRRTEDLKAEEDVSKFASTSSPVPTTTSTMNFIPGMEEKSPWAD